MNPAARASPRRIDAEVLVIGGGATGAGIARDLAMRGFSTVLVERSDWANGTSGRFNGLMHSGSRYSLKDVPTARECIQENLTLRRIMPHCIEDTGGYVVATPWDDPAFGDHLIACCHQAEIPIEDVPIATLLREEPFVHPGIRRALRVPDAIADSFLATRLNVESARQHGARALSYHPVVGLTISNQRVTGAHCHDLVKDEPVTISADMVVNAAGAWAGQVAALAGLHMPIVFSKGSMIATALRVINSSLTRLHWPSDCDSVLPAHTVSVLGCTDVVVESPDHLAPEPRELQRILDECSKLVPVARDLRQIRVWAGVRALHGTGMAEGTSSGGLSRTHAVIDHQTADGVPGIVSVVGGKWTTYRLIAQEATDRVCETLGTRRPCRTHLEPLPGAEYAHYDRHSARLAHVEARAEQGQLVCECELVTRTDVERALNEERTTGLDDVRRVTRLGMGPCQGGFCTYRGAGVRHELRRPPAHETCAGLGDFIQERWKGVVPIAAGDQLRQARLNELIFCGLLGMDRLLDS